MAAELLAVVKHDCPTCDELLPALDAAGVRVLSQSDQQDTVAQAARLRLSRVPELDAELACSERFDLDAVPTLLLLDDGEERDRVVGIHRERLAGIAAAAGVDLPLEDLPAWRPGCGSRTREPAVAAGIAARAARRDGRIRSRVISVGELEDVQEALHERGLTDGLPVVPPTPERVVAMLAGTSRDPQDLAGVVPPYAGRATVEKVAVNAVMAGCTPEMLPVVLAAVAAACDESFALHGLIATTHPAGPTVVVSGPYAERAGMESGGNCLGQGNRANLSIGRALQLTVRNVGGGRPRVEDRAAHGWAGKVSSCFAERPGLWDGGESAGDTRVTLMATEAPRLVMDQLAREPEPLAASLAMALQSVAHPKLVLAVDALVLIGPEHARVFESAGWTREQLRDRLFELTRRPAGELVRGSGGSAEGIDPRWVSDPDMPVQKFAAPDRIRIACAGGDAGLFSMVFGSWVGGEIGSTPVTTRVEDWV